jgi:hypothetical protein
MPDPSGPPKLYDVLPSGRYRAAMRAALPQDASFAWRLAGTLGVTAGRLVVMDPAFFYPGGAGREGRLLDWPAGRADVWLRMIERGGRQVLRVAAVLVSLAEPDLGTRGSVRKDEVGSSAVDSAKMMVADAGRLDACWEVGGPLNESALGVTTCHPDQKQIKEKAAALLTGHGFPLVRKDGGYLGYRFGRPLSSEEVCRADRLLAAAGLPERVNVIRPHTLAVIEDGLGSAPVVRLGDAGSPYLCAFPSGWGDGIYYWDALRHGDQLLGYLCDFMPEDGTA